SACATSRRLRRGGEFPQILDLFLESGAVDSNVHRPRHEMKSDAKPLFGLLRISRLDGGEFAVTVGGRHYLQQSLMEPRMVKLRGNSHRLRQIEMAHPQNIDARGRGNGVEVSQSRRRFDLADHRGVAVCIFEICLRLRRYVIVVRRAQAES